MNIRRCLRQNQAGIAHVSVVLGIVLLVVIGVIGNRVANRSVKTDKPGNQTHESVANLSIESDPAGLEMSGNPYCDGVEQKTKTPYECDLKEGESETVMIAPATATIDNKQYVFRTWDGCSESNVDKKVCRVKAEVNKSHVIKAHYDVAALSSTNPVATTRNTVPCSKDEGDAIYRTCAIVETEVPKSLQITPIYQDSSGNNKPPTGNATTKEEVTCNPADACTITNTLRDGTLQQFAHHVTISKRATVTIKYPRDVHFYYCGIGCKGWLDQNYLLQKLDATTPAGGNHEVKVYYKFNGCANHLGTACQ